MRPPYLAPELPRGGTPTPAADVFSFGVLAFELLSGKRPFAYPPSLAVLHGRPNEAPMRLGDLRPDLAAELIALLDAALALDPSRRPSLAELAAALDRPLSARAATR